MRVDSQLVLDATRSFDEDRVGVTGAAAGLRFAWSCSQTAPVFNASCAGVIDYVNAATSTYLISPRAAATGAECLLSLTVTDSSLQRSSSAAVTVSILPSMAPVVSVTASNAPATMVINVKQVLQLTGALSVPATVGGEATWSVSDPSIVFDDIALFPPQAFIAAVPDALFGTYTSRNIYMALRANSLPVGAALTFSLTGLSGGSEGKQATSSVTVLVNAPPTPGSFHVSPDSGPELEQTFQFIAEQWEDSDLPLTYQFGYLSTSALSMTLRSRLELSFGSSLLTAGEEASGYAVTCLAQIFDFLNADTSVEYVVTVSPNAGFNTTQIEEFISSSLAEATDVDAMMQATAQSSYLLNMANCSLAPNCSTLNRGPCLNTPHTCGTCVSELFVGEEGDSNEACAFAFSGDAGRRFLAASLGQRALSAKGEDLKPCTAGCSGHGECAHIMRDTGEVVTADMPPCVMGALDCQAVCLCEPDYFGSDVCDVPTEEFATRQQSRAAVITGLSRQVILQGADDQAIPGLVNSLSSASRYSSELTETSAASLLSLVDTVTSAATAAMKTGSSGMTPSTVDGLLETINAVAQSATKAQRRRRLLNARRGLQDTTATTAQTAQVTQALLQNLGALVADSMLPGQAPAEYSQQGEFRLGVHVLGENDANASLAVPQTALEVFSGIPASMVAFSASDAQGGGLVVSSLRSELFDALGADLKSNPVSLYSTSALCASPPCYVDIVLQNSEAVDYAALNMLHMHVMNVTCDADEYTDHDAVCPDGAVLSLACNGTAGIVSQQCPVTHYAAACNALSGSGDSILEGARSGCTMVSNTDTSVTCRCDAMSSDLRGRRLLSGHNYTEPAGYSVSYVAMLQSSTDNFVSTILTADDLNASTLTRGWRALATLGSLAAGILIALIWSNQADHKAKQIQATPEEQAQQKAQELIAKKTKKGRDKKIRFNTRAKKALVNAELAIVEESLPKVLSSRTFSDRFMEEVKQHHRWIGIIFYFSDQFPRVLRVISLATNAIVMLFIQSITYNLTNPDDGSCELLESETTCLEPKSPFATGESKCAWVATYSKSGTASFSCVFVEPDQSIRIILFVAIFCAVVTTPIALLADWVVRNILSAPTETPTSVETDTAALNQLLQTAPDIGKDKSALMTIPDILPSQMRRKSSFGAMTSYFNTVFTTEMKAKEDKAIMAASRAELMMLSMKLKRYREILRPDELEEFNSKFNSFLCLHFSTDVTTYVVVFGSAVGSGRRRLFPHES
jgi:hypothetical protein